MPNMDFCTELMNKHFELSHSGGIKLNPKLYFSVYQIPERLMPVATQSKVWVCGRSSYWDWGIESCQVHGCLSVSCECCVLFSRDLCYRPITHPEKSYWVLCV